MTTLKGRQIQVNVEALVEAIGLPLEYEKWFEMQTLVESATSLFVNTGEELVRKWKGYNPNSMRELCKELVYLCGPKIHYMWQLV